MGKFGTNTGLKYNPDIQLYALYYYFSKINAAYGTL